MHKRYYGNKAAIIINSVLTYVLTTVPWLPLYIDSRRLMAWIVLELFFLVVIIVITKLRFQLLLIICEKGVFSHKALFSVKPYYYWEDIDRIGYISVLNVLVLHALWGHVMWVPPLISGHKEACKNIIDQALESNPKIKISKKTLDRFKR